MKPVEMLTNGTESKSGLRKIGRDVWQNMLDLVKCQILNVVSNQYMDAYLLSESSLFVFPHKIILKTCGTTTLLLAFPRILEIARDLCGLSHIDKLFYSRKSFMFPEKQQWPHYSWDEEVKVLDKTFDNGSAYILGKTNGDHWYLYIAGDQHIPLQLSSSTITPPESATVTPTTASFPSEGSSPVPTPVSMDKVEQTLQEALEELDEEEDQTLEILMTDLDQDTMKNFYCPSSNPGGAKNDVDRLSGLSMVYDPSCPDQIADSYLFSPCGYSVNGLTTSLGPYYYTVHVTPEPECSYASFETNVPVWKSHSNLPSSSTETDTGSEEQSIMKTRHAISKAYLSLINQVVSVFNPGKFSVTLFRSKNAITTRIPAPSITPTLSTSNSDSNLSSSSKSSSPSSTTSQNTITAQTQQHPLSILHPPISSVFDIDGELTCTRKIHSLKKSGLLSLQQEVSGVKGFVKVDKIVQEFEDYELIFAHYVKV